MIFFQLIKDTTEEDYGGHSIDQSLRTKLVIGVSEVQQGIFFVGEGAIGTAGYIGNGSKI